MDNNQKGIPFSTDDEGENYPQRAKELVQHAYNVNHIGTPRGQTVDPLGMHDIYVVWFSYVMGNWKAILSTSRQDGRIWEVTHKRDHDGSDGPAITYVDSYIKTHNLKFD